MTERYDVAQRLAEGVPAVEHTQSYVWACHVLGYQHPDLTAYPTQVRDWYDTEDGLNLWLLDDDCERLRAAANAAEEALSRQRAQHDELTEGWLGVGARAATEFLQRHVSAGEAVAANIRAAADRCATLRDDLWRLVDAKAATAIAVDDRRAAERSAWQAASQIVLTGAADREAADDLVDHQIKPYIDSDVRTEWLDTMRSTTASVDASFDTATNAVNAAPTPRFDMPGDLAAQGPPRDEPPVQSGVEVPVPAIPAGTGAARADPPSTRFDSAAPAAPPAAANDVPAPPPVQEPSGTALGDAGALDGLSGATGLGGLGGSIGGIIGQIVDAVGELLGSLGDVPDDPSLTGELLGTDDPLDPNDEGDVAPSEADPLDLDDKADAAPDDADEDNGPAAADTPPIPPAPPAVEAPLTAPPADEAPPAGEAPPDDPPPAEPAAPPTETPPPADPPPDNRTPCEIAADDLPQAGQ